MSLLSRDSLYDQQAYSAKINVRVDMTVAI